MLSKSAKYAAINTFLLSRNIEAGLSNGHKCVRDKEEIAVRSLKNCHFSLSHWPLFFAGQVRLGISNELFCSEHTSTPKTRCVSSHIQVCWIKVRLNDVLVQK